MLRNFLFMLLLCFGWRVRAAGLAFVLKPARGEKQPYSGRGGGGVLRAVIVFVCRDLASIEMPPVRS